MILTKKIVKELLPGNELTVSCGNVQELDSAYQTALTARKEMGLTATGLYISRSGKTMSVTITRRKEAGDDE